MTKRERLHAKFGGKCAYCGQILKANFHIDHADPLFRNWIVGKPEWAGTDEESNLVPACPRCNLRKSALSIAAFRAEIAAQVSRLRRDSAAFRLAEDYSLIGVTGRDVVFWFEKYKAKP